MPGFHRYGHRLFLGSIRKGKRARIFRVPFYRCPVLSVRGGRPSIGLEPLHHQGGGIVDGLDAHIQMVAAFGEGYRALHRSAIDSERDGAGAFPLQL